MTGTVRITYDLARCGKAAADKRCEAMLEAFTGKDLSGEDAFSHFFATAATFDEAKGMVIEMYREIPAPEDLTIE